MYKLIILHIVRVVGMHYLNKKIIKTAEAVLEPKVPPTPAVPKPAPSLKGFLRAVSMETDGSILVYGKRCTALKEEPQPIPTVEEIAPVVVVAKPTPTGTTSMAEEFDRKDSRNFFEQKFDSIVDEIPFKIDWLQNNIDFQPMVYDEELIRSLKLDQQVRCIDSLDRRMIITSTLLGPVVVYQRYAEGSGTIHFTAREVFEHTGLLPSHKRLTDKEMRDILGGVNDASQPHIGEKVQQLVSNMNID